MGLLNTVDLLILVNGAGQRFVYQPDGGFIASERFRLRLFGKVSHGA